MMPEYMTAISWAMLATTPRSWVIMMTEVLFFFMRRLMMSRICPWMVTSSAVVGSSQMRIFGSQAKAMAIITRWRIPPESSWG